MCESCDKNVIPLCGEMAGWNNTKQEASPVGGVIQITTEANLVIAMYLSTVRSRSLP